MIIIFSILIFVFSLLGGLFALRFKDKLHLVLGFAAGAVIGVAFFDLLPESIELGEGMFELHALTSIAVLGFVLYLILDRFLVFHSHDEEAIGKTKGTLGVTGILLHSFLDGAAVGLAFQVSPEASLIVGVAVLTHRFSDGINTVSIILKNGGGRKMVVYFLSAISISPVLGILSSLAIPLPEKILSPMLAIFAGIFLYIGASDLLPESGHHHSKIFTTISTILGILTIYLVVSLSGV